MILIFVEESDRRNNALSLQTKKEKRKEKEEEEWKEEEVWKRTDCSAKEIAYGSSESYS